MTLELFLQLTVLGPTLVRKEVKPSANGPTYFVRPVTILPNVIELAYYSNCVFPAYSLEAVIGKKKFFMKKIILHLCLLPMNRWILILKLTASSVSILSGAKRSEAESISIDENVLIATCLEFCEILQHEFVFAPPCVQLEDAIRNTIKYMTKQQIFYRTVSWKF